MILRPERDTDPSAIREVHTLAFGRADEADLVDRLREHTGYVPELSWIAEAEAEGRVVGHLLLTPVRVESDQGGLAEGLLGLGPVAVLPERQREGIGSALIREAISRARDLGYPGIIVLGHPEYYPRFGFEPASRFGLRTHYPVPDPVFMAMPLQPDALRGYAGLVHYSEPFDAL